WTTTPWTLPSNQFAAVHPDLDYSVVIDHNDATDTTDKLIVASVLVDTIAIKVKRELKVDQTIKGDRLIGCRYMPPFDVFYRHDNKSMGHLKQSGELEFNEWRIVDALFVTTDTGTGIVHIAPAFGEDDFNILISEQARFVENEGPDLLCAVAPNGTFNKRMGGYVRNKKAPYEGRWVKDCDKDLIGDLKEMKLLLHEEQYIHEYPF